MPEPGLAGCHGRLAVIDLTSRQISELPYGRGVDRAALDEAIIALFAEFGWSPGSVT
jgi:hypothetical protein